MSWSTHQISHCGVVACHAQLVKQCTCGWVINITNCIVGLFAWGLRYIGSSAAVGLLRAAEARGVVPVSPAVTCGALATAG